jgi:hypothetical protein
MHDNVTLPSILACLQRYEPALGRLHSFLHQACPSLPYLVLEAPGGGALYAVPSDTTVPALLVSLNKVLPDACRRLLAPMVALALVDTCSSQHPCIESWPAYTSGWQTSVGCLMLR